MRTTYWGGEHLVTNNFLEAFLIGGHSEKNAKKNEEEEKTSRKQKSTITYVEVTTSSFLLQV